MALIEIRQVGDDVRLGLWRMDESPAELLSRYPHLRRFDMPYKSEARQKEFLCVRALLFEMTGSADIAIGHTESGRPFIEGTTHPPYISISHTKGYAALIMSKQNEVGVDIEYRSERILKIAERFVRDDELATTVDELLTLWCAKETLYKLHSDDDLQFMEMRKTVADDSSPVHDQPSCESFPMENMKHGGTVMVHCVNTADYALTFAWAAPKD